MKAKYLFFAAWALLWVACSEEPVPFVDEQPTGVVFVVPSLDEVEGEAGTRLALVPSGNTRRYEWEAADTVGIFPNAGSQVFFVMSAGTGSESATFDGEAWSLRESSTYYSYFPFKGDMYLAVDNIPVDFTGQCQQGTTGLSKGNFFLYSTGTTSGSGSLQFSYSMLNSVFHIDVTLPAGTYTKATLTATEPLFVKEGHYDLTNPVLVADRYTKSLDVRLENFTVQAGSQVPLFICTAPGNYQGKTLTLDIQSSDGHHYTSWLNPSVTFVPGRTYHFTKSMAGGPTQTNRTNVWHENNGVLDPSSVPNYDANQTVPCLEWYPEPLSPNGTLALLLGGDDYNTPPDKAMLDQWAEVLTARGIRCVALIYRTPRNPAHHCLSAWQDAQRAVRIIRNAAASLGYDGNKIGVVGFSAGAHLGLMLATNPAAGSYAPVDAYEAGGGVACNINWAILQSTAYATTDSFGVLPAQAGYGPDVTLDSFFLAPQLYANTLPPSICFIHGQDDPYTPRAATLMYRQMRRWGVPSEVHLYPGVGHESVGLERGIEFLKQMGFLDPLTATEVNTLDRYPNDSARAQYFLEDLWPTGRIPDWNSQQSVPYIEWHFPAVRKTDAIQIIYSGGSYKNSATDTPDVMGTRRYLNEKGMTVVTLRYRYKLVNGVYDRALVPKHLAAWQDLQRAIRKVRSEAAQYGLDPNRIGIMGASAGGHLTVMGATSSQRKAYAPVDAIDQVSCKPQWAIACCPAYALTDGLDDYANTTGGNDDSAILVPEFSFDLDTAPMMMIHGDADPYASMNSVKIWEKLSSMGVPAELHTMATRPHSFQVSGYPGTAGYTWLDRVGEYVERWW